MRHDGARAQEEGGRADGNGRSSTGEQAPPSGGGAKEKPHRLFLLLPLLLPLFSSPHLGTRPSPLSRGVPPPGSEELSAPVPWGSHGHHITSRAALAHLPPGMPVFFREAGEQLEYLGPEPDRWRSRGLREMNEAWTYDHYIDLENVPSGALEASDRYEFLAALCGAGIQRPQQSVGFLPWRMLEMYQRLATGFASWRNLKGDPRRSFVEARILNDAGILGHYAADASQPHHTTIHFNGWAEGAPNPRGFTGSRDFHSRFESAFVEAHITYPEIDTRMASEPLSIREARQAIWSYVRASNALVEQQYELEQAYGFDPDATPHPEVREFVVQRLTAGAEMLRALWWSAWLESRTLAEERRDWRW